MRVDDFREVLKEHEKYEDPKKGSWDYGIEQCRKKEIEILCEDIESTCEFIRNECTADELSWISEVWEDVAAKTQSSNFALALEFAIKKYPEEAKKYYLKEHMEYVYGALNDDNIQPELPL